MKIVYIAGRYTAENFRGVTENVRVAQASALEFGMNGIGFFCPIIHTALFDFYLGANDPGYEFWLDMTMEMLKRSDALFALPNWKESKGAQKEVAWALANQRPVFEEFAEVLDWYRPGRRPGEK